MAEEARIGFAMQRHGQRSKDNGENRNMGQEGKQERDVRREEKRCEKRCEKRP